MKRPQYELSRVYQDGPSPPPEIVPVTGLPWDTEMNRRGSLGLGMGAAAALGLLARGGAVAQDGIARAPGRAVAAHSNLVTFLAITPDGKTLLSSGLDGIIKIWSLPDGKHLGQFDPFGIPFALAISPDGRYLAASSSELLRLFSVPNRQNLWFSRSHRERIRILGFTPNSGTLISASDDNDLRLWTLSGASTALSGHTDDVRSLAVSPDGRMLASGSLDRTVKLWSLSNNRLITTLNGHSGEVTSIAFTPDNRLLASGSEDNTVLLWSVPEGRQMATLAAREPRPPARPGVRLGASLDNRSLPASDWLSGSGFQLAVSPDASLLASAHGDGPLRLWSVADGRAMNLAGAGKERTHGVVMSPDGSLLASWSSDGAIRLRTLPDGRMAGVLAANLARVQCVAISRDGSVLVSSHTEGAIVLWDLPRRRFLSYLFDPAANQASGLTYTAFDAATGQTLTYTVPCGTPIPAGATCVCNCVAGNYRPQPSNPPSSGGGGGGGGGCICNAICTCIPVFR